MKPFLQPLHAEEENRYLHLLHEGNEAETMLAKSKLIEHNMRLVAHIAKKYQSAEEDLEELISVGSYGLLKAVLSFDHTKGSKLGTYAARCIENEILMMLRGRRKSAREVSLQEPVGIDQEGNELNLMDVLVSDSKDIVEELYANEMTQSAYRSICAVLNEREREIICLRYGLWGCREYTQKEVGEKLHISRSYVSRIEKKALNKLRIQMSIQSP